MEKALEDFSRVIELQPDKASAWIVRSGIYRRLKQPKAAIEDLSQAISLEPENAAAWFRRGKLFFDLGEWADAHG